LAIEINGADGSIDPDLAPLLRVAKGSSAKAPVPSSIFFYNHGADPAFGRDLMKYYNAAPVRLRAIIEPTAIHTMQNMKVFRDITHVQGVDFIAGYAVQAKDGTSQLALTQRR
jgi:hypothetical protein